MLVSKSDNTLIIRVDGSGNLVIIDPAARISDLNRNHNASNEKDNTLEN